MKEAFELLKKALNEDLIRIHTNYKHGVEEKICNARWDCAEKIRTALALLRSQPSAGELTKRIRKLYPKGVGHTEAFSSIHEACDRLDRQAGELQQKEAGICLLQRAWQFAQEERKKLEAELGKNAAELKDKDAEIEKLKGK